MLTNLLGDVSKQVAKRFKKDVNIDGPVFRLYYSFTFCAILVCCILLSATTLIGEPIQCISTGAKREVIPSKVMNTYCWLHSTFSVKKHLNKDDEIGDTIPYHGVGPHLKDNDNVVYRLYYQWVPPVLLLQALIFYVPHWLWKWAEGGRLKSLLSGLVMNMEVEEERKKKITILVDYLVKSAGSNNIYALSYHMCELLNFVVVIGNIYMTDLFLGGTFLEYGSDVMKFANLDDTQRTDPMVTLFPRVTKCLIHRYGPSGTIESHDCMCVLALNILNEKIYIFLWFWFIILASLTGAYMIYKIVTFLMPEGRLVALQKGVHVSHGSQHDDLRKIVQYTDLGDYFLIYHVASNLEPMIFREFVSELATKLGETSKLGPDLPLSKPEVEERC